ncbi:MAG: IS1634 family transposase [Deltaproteobacteria bacterium]|nr:IS1634 family transposase [Deltaproteobacteria bacterium]
MAGYIFKKTSRGKVYYYAGESERIGKTSRRKWEVYLGPFEKIVKTMGEGLLLPDEVSSTPYGLYSAFVETAKDINLVENLDKIFPKRDQGLSTGEYFLFGILARLTIPRTKNSIQEWYNDHRVDLIFPIDQQYLTAQNFWNNLSSLDFEKINRVHHLLVDEIVEKYDIHDSYIYFDPSNFYTYIETNNDTSAIAKRGKNKHKRYELRQVNLALAVTQKEGIPVYHKTYPGNVNDVTFFKDNIDQFINHLRRNGSKEIIIVFDKGNNTKEIFDAICDVKKPKIKFIGSLRPSSYKELFKTPVEDLTGQYETDAGNTVRYKEIQVEKYGRSFRAVLTYDNRTFRKKMFTWIENMKMITDEIEEFIQSKLNIKKWRKKEAVEKKLETMTSQKKMKDIIQFKVYGDYSKLGVSLFCDIKGAKEAMEPWGKSLIFTSCKNKNIIDVIKGYRMKNDVENCFKILNNSHLLSIRPVHHWTDQMIKAHMATCVLGLELIQVMKKKLTDNEIDVSHQNMFQSLHDISMIRLDYERNKTVYKVGSMKKETREMAIVAGVKLKL